MKTNKFLFLAVVSLLVISGLLLFKSINANAQYKDDFAARLFVDRQNAEYRSVKENIKKVVKGKTTQAEIVKWFGITVTSDEDGFEPWVISIIPDKYGAPTKNQVILYYQFSAGEPPKCPVLMLLVTINKTTGVVEDFYVEEFITECD